MTPARQRPFWRRRLLVPALALLGLNAAVFLAYTLPQLLEKRTITARIDALRGDVERERALVATLTQRDATLRQNSEDARKFYGEVVGRREERLVPLLQGIEKTAKGLGLQTGHIAYQPKELKEAPLVQFGITMPISGTYQQLVQFLDRLERSKQFVTVDQVSLRERQGTGADLSVAMSAYFREGQGRSDEGSSRGR